MLVIGPSDRLKAMHSDFGLFYVLANKKNIINLGVGEPGFDTPEHIIEAAYDAMKKGLTHYAPSQGFETLRTAIADREHAHNSLPAEKENVLVVNGGKQAIYLAAQSFLNPGDEVLVPDPGWVSYTQIAKSAQALPVPYHAIAEPDLSELEQKMGKRTRMLILNTPNNPSGAVYGHKFLGELGELCEKKGVLVLSDEPYDEFLFDGARHFSIGADFFENTITVNSLSKTYAMTGWRVGYAVAKKEYIKTMLDLQTHIASCVPPFVQEAAVAALRGPHDVIRAMIKSYEKRRNLLCGALDKGIMKFNVPQGTYYLFVDVSGTGLPGLEFSKKLVEKDVASVPGNFFGTFAEKYTRFTFSQPEPLLEEGARRINALAKELAENGKK